MGFQAFAAVVLAYGASEQHEASKEAKAASGRQVQAQKEQQRQQKKLADIKATRERRRLARESRVAQSQINVATGGQASSRAAGVGGSVVTQSAGAQGFAGQQQQVGQSIFEQGLLASQASADIAGASARGQQGQAISNLATSGYSIFK